jgi:hypothetical protein
MPPDKWKRCLAAKKFAFVSSNFTGNMRSDEGEI